MRTIFVARGPDFAVNKKVESFENVNVYPMMCSLLKIKCHSSNGSIENVRSLLNNANRKSHANLGIILTTFIFMRFF